MTRTRWTPYRLQRLKKLLLEGFSNAEIARKMRVSKASLDSARAYYGLDVPPAGFLTLADAALQLDIRLDAVKHHMRQLDIHAQPWGEKYRLLHEDDVTRIQIRRGAVLEAQPDGYDTAAQLAARWGVDASYVRKVLADVPPLYFKGPKKRPKPCWARREVEPYRPPLALPVPGWPTCELAEVLGVTPSLVSLWRRQHGLPAMNARLRQNGKRWAWSYAPEAVLSWLQAQEKPAMHTRAESLKAHLAQRSAA